MAGQTIAAARWGNLRCSFGSQRSLRAVPSQRTSFSISIAGERFSHASYLKQPSPDLNPLVYNQPRTQHMHLCRRWPLDRRAQARAESPSGRGGKGARESAKAVVIGHRFDIDLPRKGHLDSPSLHEVAPGGARMTYTLAEICLTVYARPCVLLTRGRASGAREGSISSKAMDHSSVLLAHPLSL
jgi:hypothetical protein